MDRTQDPTVEELVARARAKDASAFGELVERFKPRLESQVRARLGAHVRARVDVDDIVQETFLKAHGCIEKLEWRGEEAFGRWLGSIAEHLIWRASQSCAQAPIALDGDVAGEGTSPSRAFGRKERLERLERALEGLSADHRQVIVLARLEKLNVQEIAARMERTPNAVKKLLARALLELKRHFGETTGSLRLPDVSLHDGGANDER